MRPAAEWETGGRAERRGRETRAEREGETRAERERAEDNDGISSEIPATDPLDDSEHSDTEAVLRHAFERAPLDPEIARRVDERAARITDQVRQTHGVIDDETFQTLLADDES
jgi:hypothetical protein